MYCIMNHFIKFQHLKTPCFGTTLTNVNDVHNEISRRIGSENVCYYAGWKLLLFFPLQNTEDQNVWNQSFCLLLNFKCLETCWGKYLDLRRMKSVSSIGLSFFKIVLSGYGNIRNAYRIWWWNLLGNILFEKRNDEGRITLRWTLGKQVVRIGVA
jgi:hypothetical protein